jgi:hypothetical protein
MYLCWVILNGCCDQTQEVGNLSWQWDQQGDGQQARQDQLETQIEADLPGPQPGPPAMGQRWLM